MSHQLPPHLLRDQQQVPPLLHLVRFLQKTHWSKVAAHWGNTSQERKRHRSFRSRKHCHSCLTLRLWRGRLIQWCRCHTTLSTTRRVPHRVSDLELWQTNLKASIRNMAVARERQLIEWFSLRALSPILCARFNLDQIRSVDSSSVQNKCRQGGGGDALLLHAVAPASDHDKVLVSRMAARPSALCLRDHSITDPLLRRPPKHRGPMSTYEWDYEYACATRKERKHSHSDLEQPRSYERSHRIHFK